MIKIILVFTIFLNFNMAWSETSLQLVFPVKSVHQGSLTEAKLRISAASYENFQLQKLKGQTFAKSIYFYELSPLFRKADSSYFEADAKLIFIKVPKSSTISDKLESGELTVTWDNLEIIPTDPSEKLIFGKFEIPMRMNWLSWIMGVIGLIFLFSIAFIFYRKYDLRRSQKLQSERLKEEILGCKTYEDIINLWRKKHFYLARNPFLQKPFSNLENVLFKSQFKPQQSEKEIQETMTAYQSFKREVLGVWNGV